MKKFFGIMVLCFCVLSVLGVSMATEYGTDVISGENNTEDSTMFLYTNESGEFVASGDYELDNNSVLINSQEDLENLYNDSLSNYDKEQESLKAAFEDQHKEIAALQEKENQNQKFVITKVLSDIQTQYNSDYNGYYYIIKYQNVQINVDGKETSAVVILSYDVSDNKNIKPLKAGDTLYGYVEYVTSEDSTYNMVNHGFKDEEIAFVSVDTQDRTLGIALLSIFTLLLLVLYGGKHGAKLLIPGFVLIDLLWVVLVPELEIGRNVILLASLIALELIVLITVLKSGWSKKTVVSIVSSIVVVVLVTTLGVLFGNSNGFTGKGLIFEENYDLYSNVYYMDSVFKQTISTFDLYAAMIILLSAVISASVAARMIDLAEKYAGTKDMMNSMIEEAKGTVSEYPLILATIFLVMYLPSYMIFVYSHNGYANAINSESFVTFMAIALLSIISAIITAPVLAAVSCMLMGKVEVKQIGEKK